MSWPSPMEFHYGNSGHGMPYTLIGSFVDLFGGLTYDHVNFIFADTHPYAQEGMYPSTNTNFYKFGYSEPGSFYYNYGQGYVVNDHMNLSESNAYCRNLENPSNMVEDQTPNEQSQTERNSSSPSRANSVEYPRRHQNTRDFEVVWQDNIDPDNMTYEELLELGEAVGTQNRGLSPEVISSLPISKFKCGLFSRKKSRNERCVICQMEYKRRDRLMTLPCKHNYHVGCGSRWLSINKACPICYKEVSVYGSRI
ncbi:OLC1v1005656C1 [Oldenlandia corymbosa var. corymbosa]|uniref:OLC1v1005656C1 n=1 Tax=Oldenlandia corymbosa var. corymbosa TaxID=529605 RepID=A0AAV1DGD7_OLDCO|nr:OLC1v1005656C1 [Oldenlandia corymbosa var. corymbosa]